VQKQTKLNFTRLKDVNRERLERFINRQRMMSQPVRYIHFAVHGNSDGLEFADGIVGGEWLSEKLGGVEVVMIAACESDGVGDLLRNIPFVVTLLEQIAHEDALLFAEAFWSGIGYGKSPPDAFYEGLDRCPPEVGEFAQLHTWG
jgi:hypothetical protein